MTRHVTDPEDTRGDGVLDRRRVGWALAVGATVVVLYELAALLASAVGESGGMESAAVWTILLMILVTFLTVGGFGWGLYRAIRDGEAPPDA